MIAPRTRLLRAAVEFVGVASLLVALGAAPLAIAETETADVVALRESVARDRARLIELISRAPSGDTPSAAADPELREIADRLPRTQAALRERTSTVSVDPPAVAPVAPPSDPQSEIDRE